MDASRHFLERAATPPVQEGKSLDRRSVPFVYNFRDRAYRLFATLSLLIFLASPALAQDVPIPPAPTRWVTDTAGFMSPLDVDQLDARLRSYEEQTGTHLLVWIGNTTGEVPIADWANRAFEKWGVGQKGIDKGLVLFIMAQDRKLRIEVGYGLEAQIPDLRASNIINDLIVPRIRAGDNAGAVVAGMEAVAQALGQPLPGAQQPRAAARGARQSQPLSLFQIIIYAIIGLVVLVVLATNPSLATWLLISMMSGGGHRRGGRGGGWGGGGWGGGGGGGGGWSGGGGLSGGGGASGSW